MNAKYRAYLLGTCGSRSVCTNQLDTLGELARTYGRTQSVIGKVDCNVEIAM